MHCGAEQFAAPAAFPRFDTVQRIPGRIRVIVSRLSAVKIILAVIRAM